MNFYDMQARLTPAILASLPVFLLVTQLISSLNISFGISSAIGVMAATGFQKYAALIVRKRGKDLENSLFEKWGGKPTTAMLRHRDQRVNAYTKVRYHAALGRLNFGFSMPSEADENSDALDADKKYEAAMDEIRRIAKNNKISAVQRENTSYGFARNLLAMRPVAIQIGVFALLFISINEGLRINGIISMASPVALIFAFGLFVYVLGWILFVNEGIVKRQAEAYAQELLQTIS